MTRKITGKAAKMLDELFAKHGKHVMTPEELAEVRSNPDIDDDVAIDYEILEPKRGRPKRDQPRSPTVTKSVKHTSEFWRAVEQKAQAQGITLHEAMREAIAKWLAA